jgi:hypothetical protein
MKSLMSIDIDKGQGWPTVAFWVRDGKESSG